VAGIRAVSVWRLEKNIHAAVLAFNEINDKIIMCNTFGNSGEGVKMCDELDEKELARRLESIKADRTLLKDINDYCNGRFIQYVLAICGLRRTGKTILAMRQALNLIRNGKRVTYLQINKDDTKQMLLDSIHKAAQENSEYVFIDEITYIDGFARWADCIYNRTVLKGIYCILIGTDSFGLILASHELLFDRIKPIRTTYMTYSEYKRITNNNLSEYIRTGGLFGVTDMIKYIDTSIASNIVDSINRYDELGYRILSALEDDELRTVIIKTISRISIRFIIRVLTRSYNYPEIGSAKQILEQKFDNYVIENEDKIEAEVYKSLGLNEDLSRFSNNELSNFMDYLKTIFKSIDVVIKYDTVSLTFDKEGYITEEEFILTQPALRFEQTKVYLDVLEGMDKTYQTLTQTILRDMEGNLIEAVILGETVRVFLGECVNEAGKAYDVFKFKYVGREIDMVQFNYKTGILNLYEIKRSSGIIANQYKNLNDIKVLTAVQDAVRNRNPLSQGVSGVNKYVLYSGITQAEDIDGVKYVNIADYLLSLDDRRCRNGKP